MRQRTTHSRFDLSDSRRLSFYAAVFDMPTRVMDFKPGAKERSEYTEVVRPGAFADSLASGNEVIANRDHDANRTFARTSDGSLVLQEDPRGLWASAWLPPGELGDDIISGIQSGEITGCSFRFTPTRDRWDGDSCELLAVALADVCVTGSPAYPGTEVHLRTRSRLRELLARLALAKWKARA